MSRLMIITTLFCSALAAAAASSANNATPEQAPSDQVAYGVTLYEELCASCHGEFAATTKPKRSVRRLRSSIEHFPAMNDLEFLNDEQLRAIAEALKTIPFQEVTQKK